MSMSSAHEADGAESEQGSSQPSAKALGKRRAISTDVDPDEDVQLANPSMSAKRSRVLDEEAVPSGSGSSMSRVILPTMPGSLETLEPDEALRLVGLETARDRSGDPDEDLHNRSEYENDGDNEHSSDGVQLPSEASHLPILPESFDIMPDAERINPSTIEDLLDSRQEHAAPSSHFRDRRQDRTGKSVHQSQEKQPGPVVPLEGGEDGHDENDDAQSYTLGFDATRYGWSNSVTNHRGAVGTGNPVVDLTGSPPPLGASASLSSSAPSVTSAMLPASSTSTFSRAPVPSAGSTFTAAIVIEDSPTPPLRPLASPQARLEATASGRCGVLADSEPSPEKEEQKVTLGELVCPVCLGPPAPLVATECGHAFCGPCLHSSLTSQQITGQMLRDLPNILGDKLEGTCPVCRHALPGGWGRGLRGAILRMGMVEVPIPA